MEPSSEDVGKWLQAIGLDRHALRFSENDIDFDVLTDLTDEDLKLLGLSLGHRKRLLRAIRELQADGAASPTDEGRTGPPMVRATEVQVPYSGAGRRQLTVMFVDLVGSTALSSKLDPEEMSELMRTYQDTVANEIARFEGHVAKFLGDGVLAYFGWPCAQEDAAERAVRTGLNVTDAVAALKAPGGEAIAARVGIATGVVVVGDLVGEEEARERTVIGETPNLAARLQALAEPGSVVVAQSTHRLLGDLFTYRDLGALPLKGFAEPVMAWRVLDEGSAESRFDARHGAALMALVGRDQELALLLDRWQQAMAGEGQVVLVAGEAGIGKSHLTRALRERLTAEPHARLRYFCSPYYINSALFPVISQLERAAGFARDDGPAEKLAKIEVLLGQVMPDVAATVPLIAALLSLEPSDRYPPLNLAPQARKAQTLAALMSQLNGLAARQPVLMILEDAHWLDPTSTELFDFIIERLQHLPVLLVITFRPQFQPPWTSFAHVTSISLNRLGRGQGAMIVGRVAGDKALPAAVIEKILARTDGVPLFIEELTKTLLESDLLRETADCYELTGPLPPLAIPSTLRDSLMARLDRLAPIKETAQIAACVGREFDYAVLAAVSPLGDKALQEALAQLVEAQLIFRRGSMLDPSYSFKHSLVQEAAHESLLMSKRHQVHARIAAALEEHFAPVAATEPETLAHHFTEAGLSERAVVYWLRAGTSAAARSHNLEAIAHLRRGLEVAACLPGGADKDEIELSYQLALGPCLIAAEGARSSTAVVTFARARELCERLGDPPEYLQVMHWLATVKWVHGELSESREIKLISLGLAEARGDRPALLNIIRGLGMVELMMGRLLEAREMTERAAREFEASNEAERLEARSAGQDAGAATLAVLSWALWALGYADMASMRMAAALQRAEDVTHPHTQAYVYYYASILHGLRREPHIAQGYAERCLALAEHHDFVHWRGLSSAIGGICTSLLDPLASAALVEVRTRLDDYRGAGYQIGITALYSLLCPALLLRGEHESALNLIGQGLSTANLNDERTFEAELYRLQAQALLSQGKPDARANAHALIDKALTIARGQCARSIELRAAHDLARLLAEQGERQRARDLLAPVCGWFTEGFDTLDLQEATALLDVLT